MLAKCTCFSGYQMSVLWGGRQVNKFEQVSSNSHQMSLAGDRAGVGGPMSDAHGAGLGVGLYSEVQCIMGNGHMGTSMKKQTD